MSGYLLELYLHDVVKRCWLIKGEHTSCVLLPLILFVLYPLMMMMLVMEMRMVMMVGVDDAGDHFAACTLVMLTSKVQMIQQRFTT